MRDIVTWDDKPEKEENICPKCGEGDDLPNFKCGRDKCKF